ncbi:virulence factor SrfC family protein [Oecophyllibacter saccharovorans]|uniref:virulence factor SrfC family protein n=1 Tax=Oecophyllibacter saccharovorans TaxID=2558360 RepID=UPI0011673760|nr:virulence factor SrfC family protein [Oecophyllibacter saccharovorans]TPW36325.1 hypothetical protein E3203_00565 [Oecophyllibacter saccharovorans]
MTQKTPLQTTLDALSRAAASGSAWLDDNGAGPDTAASRQLRQEARLAARLAQAVERPPAVAAYGASQAGKSYLVSSLTSPENAPLTLRYGTQRLDFLKDMNPDGGGESSGLVTRFTTRQPEGAPQDAPVPVRLLSALDVLKIAGNSFYSDFKLTRPAPEPSSASRQLHALIEALPSREISSTAGNTVTRSGLDRGDIEELEDYFSERHAASPWFRALGQEYWSLLAAHVHRMDPATLMQALAPLWGNVAEIGTFTAEAFQARLKLGPGHEAFCATEALLPRERGILNVQTLTSGSPESEAPLTLVTREGERVAITRRMASALIAELIAPLESARWPFQQQTDILDFPGARSRLLIRTEEDAQAKGAELFLRGKVDHLFQRYQQDFDITAMLLCIGDSAQEVRELPRLVTSWVTHTLGATPEARAAQEDALFLILTKFDTALVAKEGSDDAQPGRWNERLGASIVNYFDTPTERAWLEAWKPGQPFDNVQWLRNSSYGDTYERDAEGVETTLRASLAARLPLLKEGYLCSERVQRYIHAPMQAFDAAMAPNDGGVSYLAARLAPVTARNPKTAQLLARARDCAQELQRVLAGRYHDESGRDPEGEAEKLLQSVGPQILELARSRRVFGAFLRRLSPTRDEMITAWKDFSRQSAPTPTGPSSDSLLEGLLGKGKADTPALAQEGQKRKFDDFARQALATWKEKTLLTLRESPRELAYFGLDRESCDRLINQLLALAEHLPHRQDGLAGLLAERLRASCDYDSPLNQSGEKQGVICAQTIGDFIAYLGYQRVPEKAVPATQPRNLTTGQPVFVQPQDPLASLTRTQLSEEVGLTPEVTYCLDWLAALLAAARQAGPQYDRKANAALGKVLTQLKDAQAHLAQAGSPGTDLQG